ncbi:serine protease [Vulgatibacter sp.]|uniref:S1 family peptidase n=1 Tax=Vulgatibacter sp. TaxID=1971226 RepID=UPI003567D0C7
MTGRSIIAFGIAAGGLPLALALVPEPSPANPELVPVARLATEATVTLLPSRCAGAVVEDDRHVATVAHCVDGERLHVRLHDGRTLGATVAHRDEAKDHVILRLDGPARVRPVPIADELPATGAWLFFGSRPERPMPPQEVEVTRIARCPSLPGVDGAIHTTLDARPGDSGSPLLDERGALAGMVHGGARCQISTPAAGLGATLRTLQPAG